MKKCAIIIGVNKTGGLPVLAAAVQGAKDFAEWAKSQKFDVSLLTDESSPVRVEDIKKATKEYVDKRIYQQMVIYFAGHGILKSPTEECWLLSNAPDDPDEAISSFTTGVFAKIVGIPHVVIISDACRTGVSDPLITMVSGKSILPNRNIGNSDVDRFWASRPGNPALEIRNSGSDQFRGAFTSCLLKGLNGQIPSIIREYDENGQKVNVVYPYELKQYLEDAVPTLVEGVSITLTQEPFVEVVSRPPKYLSLVEGDNSNDHRIIYEELERSFDNKVINISNRSYDHLLSEKINQYDIEFQNQTNQFEFYKSDFTQSLPNIGTGFLIIGNSNLHFILDDGDLKVEKGIAPNSIFVEIRSTHSTRTLLGVHEDGSISPFAVLQDFIGIILIKENRVIDINYMPSKQSKKHRGYLLRNEGVIERRIEASVKALNGSFKLTGNVQQMIETASYLRYEKMLDPILGVYASYAYLQAGNFDGIKSILDYMKKEPEPVLYDVKLLANVLSNYDTEIIKHSSFCPLLTQGWSFLSDKNPFGKEIKQFDKYLIPGLWTTFNKQGAELIIEHIKNWIR